MNRKHRRPYQTLRIAILVLCAFVFSVNAGQENIRFETIGLAQGLSQENARAIHQDSEGYMWFATQEGLNRFDGYQFKVYSNSLTDKNSIASSWVHSIAESGDGKLWLGTRSGVSVLDKQTQKFKRYRYLKGSKGQKISEVKVVFIDSLGNIWAGTTDGLNLYNPITDSFELVPIEGIDDSKPAIVEAIVEDITNGIWIGMSHYGLFRYDNITKSIKLISTHLSADETKETKQPIINRLMIDSEQCLWIGTLATGVYLLDLKQPLNSTYQFERIDGLSSITVRSLYEDRKNNIWVGTDSGLYLKEKFKNEIQVFNYDITNPQSIADNTISSLYEDKGGVFWVGTMRGLSKWNTATAKFDYYRYHTNTSKSLSDPHINVMHNAGNEQIWIGTKNGMNLLDLTSGEVQHIFKESEENGLRSNNITALYARNKEELWIGYRSSGLSYLNRKTNEYVHYRKDADDPNSLGANGITSITGSQSGDIWVGTFGGGLNKISPKTHKIRRYLNNTDNSFSLSSNLVLTVYEDSKGMLWIGTWDKGLNLFNPALGTSKRIIHDENNLRSLGNNTVWAVHEDKQGNIWVGTAGAGLNFLSAENRIKGDYKFDRFSREHGLPSSTVFSVLEDTNNMFWLSTNRGITKFDPLTKDILNYDTTHGLQGNEFNSGAYHKMPDGKFFFGGTNGVTAFYPEDIEPNKHIPPVVLTNFQRLNEVTSMNSSGEKQSNITVSYKDYLIAFEFAGLDFASPDNNRYAYKLEGFDSNWIEARDVRKATYTNLPAGQYLFKVKASNNDGIWNENGAGIALTVMPAPWFSWWAYSGYVAIFFMIAFWLYRSYLNKLKKEETYRLELENEVQKRTVELSAANEQLMNASVTDQLTGLHNRRYLANIVKEKCAAVAEEFRAHLAIEGSDPCEGPRLFFLMFDLDGFKPINDTYGHDAGDRVIVQVGELLKSVCRQDDIVVRWGGDEFIVVGKVQNKGEVSALAERIRDTIAKYGFNIGLSQRMHLSSSIGYAMYPFAHFSPDSLSWEQVHLLADKALYHSKGNGRNTWCGMVQPATAPPVGVMNTLTHNVGRAVQKKYIILETPDSKTRPPKAPPQDDDDDIVITDRRL